MIMMEIKPFGNNFADFSKNSKESHYWIALPEGIDLRCIAAISQN
jgi:hypothetical protein